MSETAGPEAQQRSDQSNDHLVPLTDGWTTWRSFCLRSAGFPLSLLDGLSAPDAAAAIDALLACEAATQTLRAQVIAVLDELSAAAARPKLKLLRRLRRQVLQGRQLEATADVPELSALSVDLNAAMQAEQMARQAAEAAVAAALPQVSAHLRDVARNPRFREAVTWQNRKVLKDSVDVLLRTPLERRNSQARQQEQLITNYLQRYCAKNESIGFFGPIGWGAWCDSGPTLAQRHADQLVIARKTRFEFWALAALAEAFSQDPALRPWLAPRRDSRLHLDGRRLVDAEGLAHDLSTAMARLLAACDGVTAARDIAARLVTDPDSDRQSEADVFAVLEDAVARGFVAWSLEVPVGPDPESALADMLAKLGDAGLRARLTAVFNELRSARDRVAAAAGNAEALDAALGELEATFSRVTGYAPYQRHGRVYAGRGLVYEDCRRGVELDVGPDLRARVAAPLALILQSARWYSHAIAARFSSHLRSLYEESRAHRAAEPLPVAAFDHLFARKTTPLRGIVDEVVGELTGSWETILLSKAKGRQVALSADDLRDAVAAAFPAASPGWPGARHHSADILVAVGRRGPDAGRYLSVLGEVHVCDTMLMRGFFRETHPRPEELVDFYRRDVAAPQIYRVTAPNFQGHRKVWDPFLPDDLQLSWNSSAPWRGADGLLHQADLVVEDSAEGLVVRSRDGRRRFPALIYFERLLWRESFAKFGLLPPRPHLPRITIDGLVVRRESWRFLCRDIDFAFAGEESERFIAARRWARYFGLPRWIFVRAPQEYKPVYVDFDSPVSVEILAKLVRRAVELHGQNAVLGVSEMLPNPEYAWLTDAAGAYYSSELRIVAVDPEVWQPPATPL